MNLRTSPRANALFITENRKTWSLIEQDHGMVLEIGTNRLGINFRWADEQIDQFGRTGFHGLPGSSNT